MPTAAKVASTGFMPRHVDNLGNVDRSGLWGQALDRATARLGTGLLAAIIGNRGTGKTQLAACLGAAAIGKWGWTRDQADRSVWPVKYSTAADLFSTLRGGMLAGEEVKTRRLYITPRLLVIDEIQERANTEYEARTLVQIIDHRYGFKLDTLILGNLKPEAFREQMGASVMSRMAEAGGVVELVGEDRRSKK